MRAAKAAYQNLRKKISSNQDKVVAAPLATNFIRNHENNVMCWPEYQLEHQSRFQHK